MSDPIIAELNKDQYYLVKVPNKGWSTEMLSYIPGSWSIIGLGKDLINEHKERITSGRYIETGLSIEKWLKENGADENYLILKKL